MSITLHNRTSIVFATLDPTIRASEYDHCGFSSKRPVLSLFLAVADSYNAMTNDRVYRKALPRDKVIAELTQNAETQFDPDIVSLYLNELHNNDQYVN